MIYVFICIYWNICIYIEIYICIYFMYIYISDTWRVQVIYVFIYIYWLHCVCCSFKKIIDLHCDLHRVCFSFKKIIAWSARASYKDLHIHIDIYIHIHMFIALPSKFLSLDLHISFENKFHISLWKTLLNSFHKIIMTRFPYVLELNS